MILNTNDLNNIFTKEVQKFTTKGYTFNCNTMAGHQGELAKVDLISPDRKQLVRIFMDNGHDKNFNDTVTITTRLYSAKDEHIDVNTLTRHNTLWTDHGTEYNKLTYYSLDKYSGAKAFTDDINYIEQMNKKRQERSIMNHRSFSSCITTKIDSVKAKKAVLPFVQRQNRCKSYQINDIIKIEKSYNPYQDKTTYSVWAKKHWFELK